MMKRITALLLCVLVLMSLLPSSIFAAEDHHVCDDTCTHDNAPAASLEPAEAELEAENAITVTFQGEPVNELSMAKYARTALVAASSMRGRTGCRWQILADEESKLWVDIHGENENELTVSYAMVATLLDSESRAWVRCVYETESGDKIGDPIRITVLPEQEVPSEPEEEISKDSVEAPVVEPIGPTDESVMEAPTEAPTEVPAADGTEPATEPAEEETAAPTEAATEPAVEETAAPTEPAIVESTEVPTEAATEAPTEAPAAVTEETEETSEAGMAAEETEPAPTVEVSNVGAMLTAEGDEPDTVVEDETIKKYILSIVYIYGEDSIHAGKPVAPTWSAELSAKQEYSETIVSPTIPGYAPDQASVPFNYAAGALNGDHEVIVRYNPSTVGYTVKHHRQNVADDNYDVDEGEVIEALQGVTEQPVPANLGGTEDNPKYPGFTALPYITDTIAADGSTVVDIYYDRLYYLMSFELDGGHGTEPIYARYGTMITSVTEPTKPGYAFNGWTDSEDNPITFPRTMPISEDGTVYTAQWTPETANYTVAYWIVNDDGTKSLLGTHIERGNTNGTVSGKDDLADSYICGYETTHTHDDECYSCGLSGHAHVVSCFDGMGLTPFSVWEENARSAILDMEDDAPESGYIYLLLNTNSGQYWPKIYVKDADGIGRFYNLTNGQGQYNRDSYEDIIDGDVTNPLKTRSGTYGGESLIIYKYAALPTCEKSQHVHDDSKLTCEQHGHSDDCKHADGRHVEYRDTVTIAVDGEDITYKTDKDIPIKGDGTTTVNVYYIYKTYTIRFVYARSDTDGKNLRVATSTGAGGLGDASWNGIVNDTLPDVTDPNNNSTPRYFEEGNYRYYYIALTAKYGDNIATNWPSANVGQAGGYYWGSWAAAPDTGYRIKYGDAHANIVGPYPIMSDDMIVRNSTKIPNGTPEAGTYLAQNMVAWWAQATDNVKNHAYHNYFETPENEEPDKDNPDFDKYKQYNGKWYKLETTYTFTAAHNGTTRVDPVQFEGFKVVNEDKITQGNSSNYNRECDLCGTNCDYCQDYFYDTLTYRLTFWNHDDYLTDGTGSEIKYRTPLATRFDYDETDEHGKRLLGANQLVVLPENYPDSLEQGAYRFEGWYTSALFNANEKVEDTDDMTMPADNLMLYAHWVPKVYQVNVYRYKNIDGTFPTDKADKLQSGEVTHGQTIKDALTYEPEKPTYDDNTFEGWFYTDADGKEHAFDFANMPVKHNMTIEDTATGQDTLNIYAKWKSNKIKDVTVRYVTIQDGVEVEIAKTETYSAYVNTFKTYEAKTETALYEAYQSGYYPNVASSSITVTEAGPNVIKFVYVPVTKMPYRVEYWIKDEDGTLRPALRKSDDGGYEKFNKNDVIAEADAYVKIVPDNTKSVVTEGYIPLSQHVPDALEKRLILTTDDGQNVIKFIYEYNPDVAYYKVNHYLVKPGRTNPSSLADFDLYTDSEILGDVGNRYSAKPISISGAQFSEELTVKLKSSDNSWDSGKQELSAKLANDNSTALNFFYTRESYPYRVRYLDAVTNVALLPEVHGPDTEYGSTINLDAPVIEGFRVDASVKSHTIEIGGEAQNTITFYYTRRTADLKISKKVELDSEQLLENPSLELPEGTDNIPFSFTVSTAGTFYKETFDYTIIRKNDNVETGTVRVADDSNFKQLNAIELCNGDHVIIHDLALGEYTVTEGHVVGYLTTINGEQSEKQKVTLDTEGQTVTADVVNTYPFFTGDLKLSKTIVPPAGTPTGEGEIFTFTVTFTPEKGTLEQDRIIKYTDLDGAGESVEKAYTVDKVLSDAEYGKSHTITLKLKAGAGPVIVSDIPSGNITVVETIDGDSYATDYYHVAYNKSLNTNTEATGTSDTVNGVIRGGHTTEIGFKNAYKNNGQLTIVKTVTKELESDVWTEDTFSFTVTGTTLLPAGDYVIKIGGEEAVATVDADGDVKLSANPEITVSYDKDETEWTGSISVTGLPAGTYTVEETDADLGLDKYDVTPENKKVDSLELLGNSMTAEAEITNRYKRTTGNLKISKTVESVVGGVTPPDQMFTFIVHMPGDVDPGYFDGKSYYGTKTGVTDPISFTVADDQFAVTLEAGESITLLDVPVGTYTVTEEKIPGFKPEYSVTNKDGDKMSSIEVKTGETTTVACTNKYPVYEGELIIDRTSAADSEQVFVYEIRLDDADLVMQVTVVGDGQTLIQNLPYGTYKVTQLNSWSWRYGDNAQTVEVTDSEEPAEVEFGGGASSKWLDGYSKLIRNFWKEDD